MTFEQAVYVTIAIVVALTALLAALFAWRTLGKAGAALRAADERIAHMAADVPERIAATRTQLAGVDVQAEHALWMLGKLDSRMDSATADLVAKRAASDRLRVRLVDSRLTIARLRQLVRLMMRLGELRREFL